MDRVNEITAQQHPQLVELKKCKNKGIKMGLLTLVLVGGVSYASLKIPKFSQLISPQYHALLIIGASLGLSYIALARTTRKCFVSLKSRNV